MDAVLHCNNVKCRALLNDSAVVTTCSHIFCLPCADRLELSSPSDGQRKCPACGTYLANLDDAVVTALSPTEDYKTSILSGLSPTVIIECAGRGLSFWAYQMAQEITYQDYLAKILGAKYQKLNTHLETVVREANEENTRLHGKLEAMQAEHARWLERTRSLEVTIRQKDKAYKQQQSLYEKLKRQHMAAGMELAAEHSADSFLQQGSGSGSQRRHTQRRGFVPQRSGSNGISKGDERRRLTLSPNAGHGTREYMPQGSRAGLVSSQSATDPSQNSNRHRLPQPVFGAYNATLPGSDGALRNGTPLHGPNNHGRHDQSPNNGFGLAANMHSIRESGCVPPGSHAGVTTMGSTRMDSYNLMARR